ncbi:MAG: hypothetical protein Fur0032_22920 [Terrimicrobiaceae bacterium]
MKTEVICGEPSWSLHSDCVSLAVTRDGGHLAPVEFAAGNRVISPLHIAPWAGERDIRGTLPLLRVLRGDFFCMPFGGNARKWRKEQHPAHGETANSRWAFRSQSGDANWQHIHLHLDTSIRKTGVDKILSLRRGDLAIYSRHLITGGRGPMPVGHHVMLSLAGHEALISLAPFSRGQVYPGEFENPALGGYSSLKPGAMFRTLEKVPLAAGGYADLSRYPAREGFEDLVMVTTKPARIGWSAVTVVDEGYVWFSLKDPSVLASTVLWHSNGGRHYAPWNGRHRGVIGIEEVTSFFHEGLAESAAPNALTAAGYPSALQLDPARPLEVNTIMGVVPVPKGFGRVTSIKETPGGIRISSSKEKSVIAPCDTGFLFHEEESGKISQPRSARDF